MSSPKTMAKRIQEQKGEERSVAKSKPTAMNLSSTVSASSSSAKDPIASKGPGKLIASGKPDARERRNSKSDAGSSSQARLKDAYLGGLMDTATGKPVATKEESGDADLSESETGSEEDVTGKPVAFQTATEKPYASSKSDCQGGPKAEKIEWSHNLHLSPATIHHTEVVFPIVRVIYGRENDDPMDDLDMNMSIWSIFLNATLRAAIHLGQDHMENLRFTKNYFWNSVGQSFNETGKPTSEQKEIPSVSTRDFKDATWMSTSLLCEKAFQITKAKTYIFSDSVLCVVKREMILFRPGRAKLNGIRKTITSRI